MNENERVNEVRNKSKNGYFKLKIFLLIACTIVTSSAITYGFFIAGRRQTGNNTLTTTCFDVEFEEKSESIHMENALSMSDRNGLKTEPYSFSLKNTCDEEAAYTVILNVKDGSILAQFINYSLDGTNAYNLNTSKSNETYPKTEGFNTSYIIGKGSIKKEEVANIDLRVWINSIAKYEDVQGLSWEGEIKIVSGVKEIEDLKYIANRIKKTAKTTTPDFTTASTTNEGIFSSNDDDGTTYYYRGAVTNNYLKFANQYFRIVRLNGDGTLRIVYDGTALYPNGEVAEDRIAVQGVSEMTEGSEENTKLLLDKWYEENIVNTGYDKYVSESKFCPYTSSDLTDPKFTCAAPVSKKVGLLSRDEVVFAGASDTENELFYLNRGASFWLESAEAENMKYTCGNTGSILAVADTEAHGLVPVINLSQESLEYITGSGTLENPYTL